MPHMPAGVRWAVAGVRSARRRGVRHDRLRQARRVGSRRRAAPCTDAPADDRAPPARRPISGRSAAEAGCQVSPEARRYRHPARRVSGGRRGRAEPRRRRHGHLDLSRVLGVRGRRPGGCRAGAACTVVGARRHSRRTRPSVVQPSNDRARGRGSRSGAGRSACAGWKCSGRERCPREGSRSEGGGRAVRTRTWHLTA
jgi:hypothetical protein